MIGRWEIFFNRQSVTEGKPWNVRNCDDRSQVWAVSAVEFRGAPGITTSVVMDTGGNLYVVAFKGDLIISEIDGKPHAAIIPVKGAI